jgi:hypothetical protein
MSVGPWRGCVGGVEDPRESLIGTSCGVSLMRGRFNGVTALVEYTSALAMSLRATGRVG